MPRVTMGLVALASHNQGFGSMAAHGHEFGFHGHIRLRVWLPWPHAAMGFITLVAYDHKFGCHGRAPKSLVSLGAN